MASAEGSGQGAQLIVEDKYIATFTLTLEALLPLPVLSGTSEIQRVQKELSTISIVPNSTAEMRPMRYPQIRINRQA